MSTADALLIDELVVAEREFREYADKYIEFKKNFGELTTAEDKVVGTFAFELYAHTLKIRDQIARSCESTESDIELRVQ